MDRESVFLELFFTIYFIAFVVRVVVFMLKWFNFFSIWVIYKILPYLSSFMTKIKEEWLKHVTLHTPQHNKFYIGETSRNFNKIIFFVQDRRNDCPLSSIAAAPPPWGKPSNLWTTCIYSLRPRVPSWIWIRWLQYATHRNNF